MFNSAKPGDMITFGAYPQTADGSGKAPIKWRVLQNTGEELFILSEYIIDCRRYHGESADITWYDCADITWRGCSLRRWLNGEFYNAAFSDSEKRIIKTVLCTDNGEGTPDTDDKVFLLSVAEISDASGRLGINLRRTVGTDFAKAKKADGCSLGIYDKSKEIDYIYINGEKAGCSWWWLRTQGNKPSRAYFIGTCCSIRSYGNNSISRYGVRPALKLDLKRLG